MYLLDTNVTSELRRTQLSNSKVLAWSKVTPKHLQYLSVISLLELRLGALQVVRNDPIQASRLSRWIDYQVLVFFAGRVLPVTAEIAERCALLHLPTQREERDMLIAATALVHDLTVTRNVRHFQPTGVRIYNPWN